MSHRIRLDLIIKKDPHHGDEPQRWKWDQIARDTCVSGLTLKPLDRKWTASAPVPREWDVHFLSLECELLYKPDDHYVEWMVAHLEKTIADKNYGMVGNFSIELHSWLPMFEPSEPAAEPVDAALDEGRRLCAPYGNAEPWPFKTDVVDKERIIPGGMTVAELREYIQLRDDDCRLPEEALHYAVLDARFNGRDPVDAVVEIATRGGNAITAFAVAWLAEQIRARTKEA